VSSDCRLYAPHSRCVVQASGAWGSIAERGVRPDPVVVDAPSFGRRPCLLHRVKEFAIEELVPQLRVEVPAKSGFRQLRSFGRRIGQVSHNADLRE